MKEQSLPHFSVIAFDADDTLWDCQGHFEYVCEQLYSLLAPWASHDEAAQALFATERKNMDQLGYGTKAFSLSVLETAMRVSNNELPTERLAWLQQQCYTLLHLPATPLPGVQETLSQLQKDGHQMVVFTKGELLDQENKLQRSGLSGFFSHVEITSNKSEKEFAQLCQKLNITPEQLLMVGNSLRSDIAPALAIGAWAVHIPYHITWELEHSEAFQHDRLLEIVHFNELIPILKNQQKHA